MCFKFTLECNQSKTIKCIVFSDNCVCECSKNPHKSIVYLDKIKIYKEGI